MSGQTWRVTHHQVTYELVPARNSVPQLGNGDSSIGNGNGGNDTGNSDSSGNGNGGTYTGNNAIIDNGNGGTDTGNNIKDTTVNITSDMQHTGGASSTVPPPPPGPPPGLQAVQSPCTLIQPTTTLEPPPPPPSWPPQHIVQQRPHMLQSTSPLGGGVYSIAPHQYVGNTPSTFPMHHHMAPTVQMMQNMPSQFHMPHMTHGMQPTVTTMPAMDDTTITILPPAHYGFPELFSWKMAPWGGYSWHCELCWQWMSDDAHLISKKHSNRCTLDQIPFYNMGIYNRICARLESERQAVVAAAEWSNQANRDGVTEYDGLAGRGQHNKGGAKGRWGGKGNDHQASSSSTPKSRPPPPPPPPAPAVHRDDIKKAQRAAEIRAVLEGDDVLLEAIAEAVADVRSRRQTDRAQIADSENGAAANNIIALDDKHATGDIAASTVTEQQPAATGIAASSGDIATSTVPGQQAAATGIATSGDIATSTVAGQQTSTNDTEAFTTTDGDGFIHAGDDDALAAGFTQVTTAGITSFQ